MKSAFRMCVAAALGLLATAPAFAQPVAYQRATPSAQLQNVGLLFGGGHELVSLSVSGTAPAPRYSAVWVPRPAQPMVYLQGLTRSQLINETLGRSGQWSPRLLAACGDAPNATFTVVYEPVSFPSRLRVDLTRTQLNAEITITRGLGMRIAAFDSYGSGAGERFVVAFEPNDQREGQGVVFSNNVASHQDFFAAMAQGPARPAAAVFADNSQRSLTLWDSTSVGAWIAHHDMTQVAYETLVGDYWQQTGRYPVQLSVSGVGSASRFAAIWASDDRPLARQLTSTGLHNPELDAMDDWVRNRIQQDGTHAAALAIARDGKLVHARAYTWAPPGYPVTQPTSRFRIASVAKPLTSIAVHREMARAGSAVTPTTTMAALFGNPTMADARADAITIEHLLTHTGGWDRNVSFDAMFQDANVATALGIPLPVGRADIRTWMNGVNLDFTPGTAFAYSNYGFSLLGQILENQHGGASYQSVMQSEVFDRLGITRAQAGGSLAADRLSGEVSYHPLVLGPSPSVMTDDRPWVPGQYGGWNQGNFAGHGSWVMAAPDLAKVLAAFDLGPFNPLLSPTSSGAMFAPSAISSNWARGWRLRQVPDGAGGTIGMRWHDGVLAGTRTIVGRRTDGLSFVLLTNGDVSLGAGALDTLSNLANSVTRWPTHDLFPSTGLPGFRRIDGLATPVGQGCAGSTGNTLRLAAGGNIDIGSRLVFDVSGAPTGAPLLFNIGTAPLQLDLDFLGAPGCILRTTPTLTLGATADRSGRLSLPLTLPLDPDMVGAHALVQALAMAPGANRLGLLTTGALDLRFGGLRGN